MVDWGKEIGEEKMEGEEKEKGGMEGRQNKLTVEGNTEREKNWKMREKREKKGKAHKISCLGNRRREEKKVASPAYLCEWERWKGSDLEASRKCDASKE